jgi:Zn-dependent oligopeptidase
MKNLIKKILKEEFDNFEWVNEIPKLSPAEEFLYDLMSSLKMVESKKWENWVIYRDKNGKNLMADNINTGTETPKLWVHYDEIWEKLRSYGLNSEEIEVLCIRILEATHKRKVLTAKLQIEFLIRVLEATHKRKVLTANRNYIAFG